MRHAQRLHALREAMVASAAAILVVACGGGGSASPPPSGGGNAPPATPTTGTVAVVLRDAPTDAFCRIYADIERIDLLGKDGPTNVATFNDPADDGRFDLLALQNQSELLTVATEVPIGDYEKVRLTLDQLSLVECVDNDVERPEPPGDWEHPKIPGNGKLDLIPRWGLQVIGGETLLVELDMDMKKSLHLHQTGQGNGKWQFRPVVFVTVTPDSSRLVRVFGEVRDSNGGQSPFELCPLDPTAPADDSDDMSQDDDSGRCLDVFLRGPGTLGAVRVFDDQGNEGTYGDGDVLTAVGFLGLHDDDDDNDSREDDLRLEALVLQVGPAEAFESLKGEVATERRGDGVFALDTVPEDSTIEALLDVQYQGGPILDLADNNERGPDVILPGAALEVNGVFTDPTTDPKTEPVKATLILFGQPGPGFEASLQGRIKGTPTDVDPPDSDEATNEVIVETGVAPDPLVERCVVTDANTRYLEIDETASPSTTEEFADFVLFGAQDGDDVEVFGSYVEPATPDTSCVLADTLQRRIGPAAP